MPVKNSPVDVSGDIRSQAIFMRRSSMEIGFASFNLAPSQPERVPNDDDREGAQRLAQYRGF